jgi:hypothetical protein
MNWSIIFASICLILGFASGIAQLRSMRAQPHPQAEIAWKQDPLWAWKYEPWAMAGITIHSLGLLCLAVLLLLNLRQTRLLTFVPGSPLEWLLSILALFGIFLTTYTSGTVIAYHFARRLAGPRSYGISREGIFFGKNLMSWKTCSHYELGPDDGQISLYSSYSPALRTWVFQPAPESFSSVLALIQENLPASVPMGDAIPWQRSPLMLSLQMTALTMCLSLPAVWGLFRNHSWVWIYAFVQFYFVGLLGNNWITIFSGRGKEPERKVPVA